MKKIISTFTFIFILTTSASAFANTPNYSQNCCDKAEQAMNCLAFDPVAAGVCALSVGYINACYDDQSTKDALNATAVLYPFPHMFHGLLLDSINQVCEEIADSQQDDESTDEESVEETDEQEKKKPAIDDRDRLKNLLNTVREGGKYEPIIPNK